MSPMVLDHIKLQHFISHLNELLNLVGVGEVKTAQMAADNIPSPTNQHDLVHAPEPPPEMDTPFLLSFLTMTSKPSGVLSSGMNDRTFHQQLVGSFIIFS